MVRSVTGATGSEAGRSLEETPPCITVGPSSYRPENSPERRVQPNSARTEGNNGIQKATDNRKHSRSMCPGGDASPGAKFQVSTPDYHAVQSSLTILIDCVPDCSPRATATRRLLEDVAALLLKGDNCKGYIVDIADGDVSWYEASTRW